MATRIQAINALRPKIKLGKRAGTEDLVQYMARSTGLNESGVRQVLLELRDTTLFFALRGQPVYLEGLGTYTPTIGVDGEIGVGHRADVKIKNGLNARGAFKGDVINAENIGKTGDELVALWNAAHPDDPVV
jgi:hypothetical protein